MLVVVYTRSPVNGRFHAFEARQLRHCSCGHTGGGESGRVLSVAFVYPTGQATHSFCPACPLRVLVILSPATLSKHDFSCHTVALVI